MTQLAVLEKKVEQLPPVQSMPRNFGLEHLQHQLQETQAMVSLSKQLLQLPHYKKIGESQLFLIVETAVSLGIDPRKALNGGLYAINGKIEMSGRMMNELIRRAGHSIEEVEMTDEKCVLKGKRADSGNEATGSFSIEDAKKAGIYRNTWTKFPKDMLYWRAFSQLARRLFSDVIGGCYIEGEIRDLENQVDTVKSQEPSQSFHNETKGSVITEEEYLEVETLLERFANREEIEKKILSHLNIKDLRQFPSDRFAGLKAQLEAKLHKEEEQQNG